MAHFTTFYSYKGGVGRTLALANVAWLLANHPIEPARVLVVDFDLGAPGLHRVFGMKGSRSALGIVDYVSSFLAEARVPDLTSYLHKTEYANIDILPAGKMDSRYQNRLEGISWGALYESAHGYQLIESLKNTISATQPEYDYVLIDSLTGYSDIGGICVRQLPDSLILLFRLNLQNLEGIKAVREALQGPDYMGADVPIIPVISPSWPFLDKSAAAWISKAQAVFPDERLFEISFDSGLSFGEQIISKSASKLSLTAKVLADYKILAAKIREQNSLDPWTLWENIRDSSESLDNGEQADKYLRLLSKRPHIAQYWQYLPRFFFQDSLLRKSEVLESKGLNKLAQLIDDECSKNNKHALLCRSLLASSPIFEGKKLTAIEELNKALRIDPEFLQGRLQRAQVLSRVGRNKDATADFLVCLNQAIPASAQKTRIEISLASTYLRMLDPKSALKHLMNVASRSETEAEVFLLRGKCFYLLGEYEKALADINKYLGEESWHDVAQLLPAQILAAIGDREGALRSLRDSPKTAKADASNLAEAYLAIDPAKALSTIRGARSEKRTSIKLVIELLARLFSGEELSAVTAQLDSAPQPQRNSNWDYFEVIAMIRAKQRDRTLNREAIALAYKIVSTLFVLGDAAIEEELTE